MKLILASGSPRRKELLEQIGLEFSIITSNADEDINQSNPEELVKELSKIKAEAVLRQCKASFHEAELEDFTVIGADTIVYANGQVYGKPSDEKTAYDMIKSLSGNVHQVYTGVSILCSDGRKNSFFEKTDVEICPMSDDEIYGYIHTKDCFDKAGSYGIQGTFAAYVKGIHGDYNNVVGLPVSRVYQELKGMKDII